MGYGGVKALSDITGIAETTIRRGAKELADPSYLEEGRVRNPGGGRKKTEEPSFPQGLH